MEQAALNINALSEQMGVVAGQIKTIRSQQIDHNNRITDLENWKIHHEETERVNRTQARRIRSAIHARVNYILGIELTGGLVKKECMSIDKKYRGAFYARCYSDARKYSSLGTPYSETCVKDYQAVLDYIETWEPECEYEGKTGTRAYIAYLDDRARA
jgi:hypothetical protein